jgi:hypothetical protein
MQQGGVYELASKFGISKERAQELIQMQMGGQIPQQPQGQEEQIMQMVMQMLQSGATPEEAVQQLIQSGVPQDQAVQVVEMMMQQSQGEGQMEGQMSNPQGEQMEIAQQGGRIGNKYEDNQLFKKQEATTEDWNTFGELLKTNPTQVTAEIKRLHPELYNKFFVDGLLPKSKVDAFQNAIDDKYKLILDDAKKLYVNDPEKLKQLEAQIEQDKFINYSMEAPSVRGRDNKFGNYTATRPNFAFNILPKEELDKVNKAGVNTASELKDKFPDLYKQYVEPKGLKSDFWLSDINQPLQAQTNIAPQNEAVNNQVQPQQVKARNYFPMMPQDLRLPPSGVPSLLKSEVNLGRIEPIKQTVEPYLAEQARQQLTAQEQLSATGLPPQIQQALQAQNLASGQMASNDAISKVEQFNTQNQFQADQFNIGQRAKEDITNEQFAQDYQSKMLGSMANTERDYRAYLNEGNQQNRANWQSVENANLLNRMSENYKYTPGQGVEYIPSVSGNIATKPDLTEAQMNAMTPQEYYEFMKKKMGYNKNQQSV